MSDSKTETPQEIPNIHFFYGEHTEDKIDEIWEQCENADVILLELIVDKDLRYDLEGIINYASFSNSREEKDRAIAVINNAFGTKLFKRITERIINDGKEVYLIDVNTGEAPYMEAVEANNHIDEAIEQFLNSDFDNSYSNFTKYIKLLAKSGREREDITAEEIQGIVNENMDKWAGKNIAVIQGALHTRTYHEIKRNGAPLNFSYSFPSERYRYPATYVLARKLMFNKPVAETDYKRAYFSLFLITNALIDVRGEELTDSEINAESVRIAGSLTDSDLEKYWKELKNGTLDARELVQKHQKRDTS